MNVDTTKKPFTAVEWCAGYAGIHLGLKRVIPNLRVIAFSEIESFACENLVAKMEAGLLDAAPIWTNLKTFPCADFFGKVDLLVAGYPCQPFSAAGKRLGTEDERHLWPYIAAGIRAMRPRFCFFENVEGHITLGLSTVISDLAEMGYKTTWGVFSASEVGAPHQRKRVFILAYSISAMCERGELQNGGGERTVPQLSQPHRGESNGLRDEIERCCTSELAYNTGTGLQGMRECCGQEGRETSAGHNRGSCQVWPSRPGEPQYEWEPPRCTRVVGNTSRDNVSRQAGGFGETQVGRTGTEQFRSEVKSPMGSNFNEYSGILDRQLTPDGAYGIVDENTEGGLYAPTEKAYAREVLQDLWDKIGTEGLQRTFGRYENVLAETVLRSGVRLDGFTQRICFFVWCIQTGNAVKGWGLSEMRGGNAAWGTPQGQEPAEQLRRELAYALCQLSYEIALERGQEPLETKGAVQSLWRDWEIKAWNVSEALPEMEEVWRSTFDEAFRKDRVYIEATHMGHNRVDSLRLLGNGVVPATAARAWEVLYSRVML